MRVDEPVPASHLLPASNAEQRAEGQAYAKAFDGREGQGRQS